MSKDKRKNRMDCEEKEKETFENFKAAYAIKGRGVGTLELNRAIHSEHFRNATKELVRKIHTAYPKLKKAN